MASVLDAIIEHLPNFGRYFGNDLSLVEESMVVEIKQVEIPMPIQSVVTEH